MAESDFNKEVEEYFEPLNEMATFGAGKWGKETYKVAVHGASTKDRETPHIHIYLYKDHNPYSLFNFEISMIDILCKDEINLIFQTDRLHNVDNRNRSECSWTGYRDLKEGFTKFLFSKPKTGISDYKREDNLARAIFEWNRETDFIQTTEYGTNMLGEYFAEHHLTVLPKYAKYLENYELEN